MNRFCSGVLTTFRVIQFLLSLILLGCGAYITYSMFSLASSAHQLESAIDSLQNPDTVQNIIQALGNSTLTTNAIQDSSTVLQDTLVPVLHKLEGLPIRAIIVTAAGLCSIILIIYLFVAHRRSNPNLNRRSVRVPLELTMFILWLAAVVCAVMLALEYGFIVLAGGVEMKTAFTALKEIIGKALTTLYEDGSIARALSIVNDLVTIGALAIITVAAAIICASVSLISLIVACCVSGKKKDRSLHHGDADQAFLQNPYEKHAGYSVVEYSPSPSHSYSSPHIPTTPMTPAMMHYYEYQGGNGYRPV